MSHLIVDFFMAQIGFGPIGSNPVDCFSLCFLNEECVTVPFSVVGIN